MAHHQAKPPAWFLVDHNYNFALLEVNLLPEFWVDCSIYEASDENIHYFFSNLRLKITKSNSTTSQRQFPAADTLEL